MNSSTMSDMFATDFCRTRKTKLITKFPGTKKYVNSWRVSSMFHKLVTPRTILQFGRSGSRNQTTFLVSFDIQ